MMDDTELALRLSGDPSGALQALGQAREGVSGVSSEVVNEAARMVAAVLSIEKAFEGLRDGIIKADEIRDLSLSLDAFTGSVQRGTQAMDFFIQNADRTRNTAEQLGDAFRNIFPLASTRGFTEDATEQLTLMLSQLATVAGTSLDSMEMGFQRLLTGSGSGGGAARNPLARLLGLTADDIKNMNFDTLLNKMQEVAQYAEQFGQSFESTMTKTKEAWMVAFGEGFNDALGGSREALDEFRGALTSPAFLDAFRTIGEGAAHFVEEIAKIGDAYEGIKSMFEGWQDSALGEFLTFMYKSSAINLAVKEGTGALSLVQGFYDQFAATGAQQRQTTQNDAYFNSGLGVMQAAGLTPNQFAVSPTQLGEFFNGKQIDPSAYTDFLHNITIAAKDHAVTMQDVKYAWDAVTGALDNAKDPFDNMRQSQVSLAGSGKAAAEAEKELGDRIQDIVDKFNEGPATVQIDPGSPLAKLLGLGTNDALGPYLSANPTPDLAAILSQYPTLFNTAGPGGEEIQYGLYPGQSPSPGPPLNWNTPGITDASTARSFADQLGDAIKTSDRFKRGIDEAGSNMAAALTGALTGGDPGQILASGLRQTLGAEMQALMKTLIGTPELANGKPTGRMLDAQGNDITGQSAGVQAGVTALQIGAGGYEAGLSGQPGSRTGAVIAGAAAGAEFGIYGAIIGAIVGAIGGALGASARQADYQYGIPTVTNGIAGLTDTKNLSPGQITQITTQVQQEYDAIHSGLMDLILKFPNLAIPSFDEITGKFQDNPSAHWGDHLQQWISGTLPKEMIASLGDELAKGFESLGMSQDAFKHIFNFLQGVDPKQAVQDLSDLADALQGIFGVLPGNVSSINDFFHGTFVAPDILGHGGSNTYETGLMQIGVQNAWSPGQRIANTYDSQILRDAAALNAGGLSPEEQIKYIGEISSLMKQRYDAEKQAIQDIYN